MKFILLTVFSIAIFAVSVAQTTKKPTPVIRKTVTTEQLRTQINDAYSKGDFAKTIILCNQLLARTPNDTFNTVTKILCKAKLKKHKEAIADLKQLYKTNAADFLSEFPTDVYAAEFKERMPIEERELYFTEAGILAPADARVYFNHAYEYLDDNNCSKAMELAEKGYPLITAETSTFTRTYIYIQKKCGDRNKAWKILTDYANKYPDDLNAKVLKATFLTEDKKYTEAMAFVNEAIAIMPEGKDFYLVRASIYFKMDDKAAACKEAKFIKEKFNDAAAELEFKCSE
jgi:tetratricopeptide (TPR) repeat protein